MYAGHPLTSVQNFTEFVLGQPPIGSVKHTRGMKIRAILDLSKAISHKRYKIDVLLLLKTNRKSYVLHGMVILPISLGDP